MKKNYVVASIVFLLVLICSNQAFAYRPFVTDGAEVVGKGVFLDELGWDHLDWKNKDTDDIYSSFMFLGITKDLHVGVGVPYSVHSINEGPSTRGWNDFYYYAKYVGIRDAKGNAAVSYKFQGKWNNGDYYKILGFGDKEYQGSICITQPIGDILQIHGQLGYNLVSDAKNENYSNYVNYGVAADYSYTKELHFLFEVSGNENPDKTLESQRLGTIGFNYTLNDHFVFDATYRHGLTDTTQKNQYGIGLTVIF